MNFSSWDKLQVKYKIILFGLNTVIITYLLYSFLLVPQWMQRDELKQQCNAEQQQVQVVENFVTAHPNPEGYLLELDTKIAEADNRLPDNPNISNFLLQMEQLAEECGVQLTSLKPGKIDNKQDYREIAVEISIKGNFLDIMNFLHKTESGSRFMSIASMSMKLGENGLESKMVAKIYSHGVTLPVATNANPVANKK